MSLKKTTTKKSSPRKTSPKKSPAKKASAKKLVTKEADVPSNGHSGNGHNNNPIVIDGQKHMTPLDLAQFQLLEQKWVNAQLIRKEKERERELTIQKLDNVIVVLKQAELKIQREYLQIRRDFSEKYGVNFNDPGFSFDDETGRLILFDGKSKEGATPQGA